MKEEVLAIIGRMDFSEYLEEKTKCPDCKQNTLTRHIQKEAQQKWKGKWFVEFCTGECDYWDCGFLPKRYKPQSKENYRIIPDHAPHKKSRVVEKDE